MSKTQFHGIRFPINVNHDAKTLFDLNYSINEKVQSEIMHVIFTPKGQRLRNPDFGTSLIQFIFNPSDTQTWEDIVFEIKDSVRKWVKNCSINDIELAEIDNGYGLAAKIIYTLSNTDGTSSTYELITKI